MLTNSTVGAYLDTWLAGKHALKPSTQEHYGDCRRLYIRPHLGHPSGCETFAHTISTASTQRSPSGNATNH